MLPLTMTDTIFGMQKLNSRATTIRRWVHFDMFSNLQTTHQRDGQNYHNGINNNNNILSGSVNEYRLRSERYKGRYVRHCSVRAMYLSASVVAGPTWGATTSVRPLPFFYPFNDHFFGTSWVSRYQKGKTNQDFTEARDKEWQWHQLDHMQICTSFQTDNHTSMPPHSFFTG